MYRINPQFARRAGLGQLANPLYDVSIPLAYTATAPAGQVGSDILSEAAGVSTPRRRRITQTVAAEPDISAADLISEDMYAEMSGADWRAPYGYAPIDVNNPENLGTVVDMLNPEGPMPSYEQSDIFSDAYSDSYRPVPSGGGSDSDGGYSALQAVAGGDGGDGSLPPATKAGLGFLEGLLLATGAYLGYRVVAKKKRGR